MSFLHPEFFYYMLPFLLILFGFLLTQKEAQKDFFSEEVIKKLQVGSNMLSLKARNILFLIIAILIIVGLAGPVIKKGKVEVKSKSSDIVIALDISDSMLAEDVYPNRLKLAKQKAMDLLSLTPNERIGIMAFAKNSYLVSPMSFDHDAVAFLLKQLSTDSITEKGTDFLSLLNVVENTIETKTKKHLLILSDGGDADDFSDEIAYAKEKNIMVYVLGIGTAKGAPIKKEDGSFITHKGDIIVSKLNQTIAKLATATGGVYIESIKSNDDVKAMLHEIESASEKKELKSETIEKFIPLFYYPVGLALFLLLFALSSLKRATPSLVIALALSFVSIESKAGLLDFMDLEKAKQAYVDSNYTKAQKIYANYALDTNNSQSYYNKGNALYKQNKYDEAMQAYEKAKFDDNISQAKTKANIGNTYVKQGKEKALENAVKSYEESLSLYDDKEIRENLEAVKKELEKQKEEQKKEQDKKDKKDKDKQENSDENQEKNEDDSSEKQDGDDSDKSKENQDKSDEKKEEDSKNDKNKSDEKQGSKKDEEKNANSEEEKKEDLEELENQENKSESSNLNAPIPSQKQEMSEAEEEKWLNKLNSEQNTYMYMLNNTQQNKENSDEKPW